MAADVGERGRIAAKLVVNPFHRPGHLLVIGLAHPDRIGWCESEGGGGGAGDGEAGEEEVLQVGLLSGAVLIAAETRLTRKRPGQGEPGRSFATRSGDTRLAGPGNACVQDVLARVA